MFAEASSDGLTVQSSDGTSEELQAELQPVAAAADAPEHDQESEDAEAAPAVVKPAAKPRNNPIARMEEATAKEAAAKRDAEAARRETAELRQRLDALERPKPEVAKPETKQAEYKRYRAMPDAPKLGEFDGDEALEDWNAAFALFVADKRWEEHRDRERRESIQESEQSRESEYERTVTAKIQAAIKAEPGFLDRIDPILTQTDKLSAIKQDTDGSFYVYRPNSRGEWHKSPVPRPTFGNWLVEQIYRSGPVKELLEYFNDDIIDGKKEAQRLAALPPDSALREFGQIIARLTPAAAPLVSGPAPTVKSSVAKPPIRPERGSAQVGSDEPPGEDASDAEHEAYWGPRRAKLRHA